ncbi:hypothetical protein PENSUB_12552 [Penicillium subrubescens]|uniref:Uncharacterized protein n=1 Tax=Penicillium subrubescens TaxID=1316194 RepID=A0A1Q5SY62_9EURO|nr:hypothetical protein PENSUB_12552 [Penicillium subrubescens]
MGNPLRSAAGLGEVEICDILIQAGADLNCLTGDAVPTTALHRDLENAQNECVTLLLAAGADPNLTVDKRSPLQVACSDRYSNPLERVRLLCRFGDAVNPPFKSSRLSPLQLAIRAEDTELARYLLKEGADPDFFAKPKSGTPLQLTSAFSGNSGMAELVLGEGANINSRSGYQKGNPHAVGTEDSEMDSDSDSESDLDFYYSGNDEGSEDCLENGAHVNALPSERNGKTALQFAVAAGNIERVEILLDSQAAVNTDPYVTGGVTALKEAARLQDPAVKKEILHILMRAGVDTEILTSQSRNAPLHSFVECGDLETTRKLLEKGVSPNPGYSAESHLTPLQEASALGQKSLVELLIKHGADINAPAGPYKGRTALQAAAEKNRQSVVDLLLKSEADIKSEASHYREFSAI